MPPAEQRTGTPSTLCIEPRIIRPRASLPAACVCPSASDVSDSLHVHRLTTVDCRHSLHGLDGCLEPARIQMLEGDAALVVLGLLGEGRASASHASAGC